MRIFTSLVSIQELYHCLECQVFDGHTSTHLHQGDALVLLHGHIDSDAVLGLLTFWLSYVHYIVTK